MKMTLTALEIVLGIDNVIFISVIVSRILPGRPSARARSACCWRWCSASLLLSVLVWLIGLTEPVLTVTTPRCPGATSS